MSVAASPFSSSEAQAYADMRILNRVLREFAGDADLRL
jgi:hypothetical protein